MARSKISYTPEEHLYILKRIQEMNTNSEYLLEKEKAISDKLIVEAQYRLIQDELDKLKIVVLRQKRELARQAKIIIALNRRCGWSY